MDRDEYYKLERCGLEVQVLDYSEGVKVQWEVWLDASGAVLIGRGATRDEAVTAAVATIEAIEAILQGPPPQKAGA